MGVFTSTERISLRRLLHKKALGITGERVRIMEILHEDELGYITEKLHIYLSFENDYLKRLEQPEMISFVNGLFAHELMHYIMTDFSELKKYQKKLTAGQKQIFHFFANIIEDSCIEYYMPMYIGGVLLRDFEFLRAVIYNDQPLLESEETALGQVTRACIHFCRGGMLKGSFTFPEAEKIFQDIIMLLDRGVTEPDATERLNIAYQVFEITRPLWQNDADAADKLQELMKQAGISSEQFGGKGERPKGTPPTTPGNMSERRQITIIQVMGDDTDKEPECTENADTDEKTASQKGADSALANEQSNDSRKEIDSEDVNGDSTIPVELSAELSQKEKDALSGEFERAVNEQVKKEKEDAKDWNANLSGKSLQDPIIDCENTKVFLEDYEYDDMVDQYEALLEELKPYTAVLRQELKKVFYVRRRTQKNPATKGRIDFDRLYSAKRTSKVFQKRFDQSSKNSIAVMVLLDQSGSMRGEKIEAAKKTAICLAELMEELHIPMALMGFSASWKLVYHDHYIYWNNRKESRYRLMKIEAGGGNRDGYSIRYATDMLKARKEKNKLLIVLSDGAPSAYSYDENGVEDTRLAIRHAKKISTVAGILIGNQDDEILKQLYGSLFLQVQEIEVLFKRIGRYFATLLKGW